MASDSPRLWPALELAFPGGHPGTDGADTGALPDLAAALLDDHSPTAVAEIEDGPSRWRVFFATDADRDAAAATLTAALGQRGLAVAPVEVEDDDWAARSQASLRAVRVDDLVVAPPWDTGSLGERWRVTILPSMGFGTGHHESTRLCLRALQSLSLTGRAVLDVGTGSGVLAIAAALMGATRVLAVDQDADAVDAARDGVDRNGCADRISLERRSLADLAGAPPADVVLANLTSAPLIRHAATLASLVAPGGALVVSGFTEEEEAGVRAAFGSFIVERRDEEHRWCALTLRVPNEQRRRPDSLR